ncbi:MAG: flagellar brake domain-containing protein [Bacillota bacterium]
MSVDKIFRENMLIEVYDEESKIYYKSLIQEVDEGSFAIGVPMKGQNQLMMREKNSYSMRTAVGDALYSFNSRMIGRTRSGNIPLFVLAWPDEIKRSQRRQFFRLAVSLDAHYWILQKGKSNEEDDAVHELDNIKPPLDLRQPLNKLVDALGEPARGIAVDISGGGVALVVNRFIPEGSLLAVRLFLKCKTSEKVMLLKGRVMRCFNLEVVKGLQRHRLGVEFEDMSEKVRDDLINFIFTLSREKARQGV